MGQNEAAAAEYFQSFRKSRLEDYGDAMREYRVGGDSGYQWFDGCDVVVQTMRDIFHNLEEFFADTSVPKGFVTAKRRTEAWRGFLMMLESREAKFGEISASLISNGRKRDAKLGTEFNDHDYLPEPLVQINKIRGEMIDALRNTLELDSTAVAFSEIEPVLRVKEILNGFHRFVLQLQKRHGQRKTLQIEDEYDVQDALHALLKLHFKDIRAEEYTPSYAGGSSRIDFLLSDNQIAIEVKMTRTSLKDKHVGDQAAVDIVRYQAHPKCRHVIFFIYDPAHHLVNPDGLSKDLSKTLDSVRYEVVISPAT